MRFTKMQGAGNDFIIINNMEEGLSDRELSALAVKLCALHTGVGADGLMAVEKSTNGADAALRFYNRDGSIGEMCGNGARCLARYCHDRGLAGETQRIETVSGTVVGERLSRAEYRVRLNDPTLIDLHRPVNVGGREYGVSYVELGTPGLPHCVVLTEESDRELLRPLGRALRSYAGFPKGANVNFVSLLGKDRLRVLTYERGVEDFTLACGTGCGSTVAALTLLGLVSGENVELETDGGLLRVSLARVGTGVKDLLLTGPAVMVFEGVISD